MTTVMLSLPPAPSAWAINSSAACLRSFTWRTTISMSASVTSPDSPSEQITHRSPRCTGTMKMSAVTSWVDPAPSARVTMFRRGSARASTSVTQPASMSSWTSE